MKLFHVKYAVHSVVIAEDETDAFNKAEKHFSDAARENNPEFAVELIESKEELPHGWDEWCFPYGLPAIDKRIKDYL